MLEFSPLAIGLVILSAVAHAFWNFCSKKSNGGARFVYLVAFWSMILWSPLAAFVVYQSWGQFTMERVLALGVTAAIHLVYFLFLQQSYRKGDLSLVYPLSRGLGPALTVAAAVPLLGEYPSVNQICGVLCILLGAGGLGFSGRSHVNSTAIVLASITGAFVAAYTLWDKYAVVSLGISPILIDWCNHPFRSMCLYRFNRPEQAAANPVQLRYVIAVAVLSPASYITFLFAISLSQSVLLAPLRELSIVIGAVMGGVFLGERFSRPKLWAIAAITVGVALVALKLQRY